MKEDLNAFLTKVITNSQKCQTCMFNHSYIQEGVSTCFFTYVCISNNFSWYKDCIDFEKEVSAG